MMYEFIKRRHLQRAGCGQTISLGLILMMRQIDFISYWHEISQAYLE